MKLIFITCVVLSIFINSVTAITSKTLVVLDSKKIHQTHANFFKKLEKFGEVEYAYSFNKEIKLKYYDEYIHDQLIIFSTSEKQQQSGIKINDIISFYDSGRNVIIAADIDISRSFRKAFYAFGIELDQTGHQLKDNFNHYLKSNTIVTSNFQSVYPFITDTLPNHKLLYRGIGLKLANFVNHQLFSLVNGEHTTYSKNVVTNTADRAGGQISLLASVQGLNNARALLTGSLDFFSDQFTSNSDFDNNLYVDNLLRWIYKKSGILRTSNIKYHTVGETQNEIVFTVNENIHYQIDVEQYNYKNDHWQPYISDDLSVEFVMLDPWVIKRLTNVKKTKTYFAQFYSPSKQGIYQFKFIYERPGYNFITQKSRVTSRPKRHDEFERFLPTALPYYSSVFATILGSFIFIILFLYSKFGKQKSQ